MATTADPANAQQATNRPTPAKGWGTDAPDQPLRPMEFERRALRPDDVAIKITYAGICHSDLHTVRGDWGGTVYPSIPGHEIVGRVTAIGSEVTRHRVGDTVAVGCMVDSCMACDQCLAGWEVFCREGCTQTYNSPDRHTGENTKGGYTDHIVVRDHFVLKVPEGMDEAARRAVAVRRDHDLLAAPPVRRRPRQEAGGGRPRRPRPHGREARRGDGRARHDDHDHAEQGRGRARARRGRRDHLDRPEADARRVDALRFHPQHHSRQPRDRSLSRPARPLGTDGHRRRAERRCRASPGATSSGGTGRSAGRPSAAFPRPRKCSISAPPKASIPDVEFIQMSEINEAYERLLKNDVRYRFVVDMSRGL